MINRRLKGIQKLLSPRSLRYQLLTRILFILAFILLVIGVLQYFVMKDFLYQNEAEMLKSKMKSLPRGLVQRSELPTTEQDRGKPTEDGNIPQFSKFLFMENISIAIIGSDGTSVDLLSDNGLPAPKLSENEYASLLEEFSIHSESDYIVGTDTEGTQQLMVFRPLIVGLVGEPDLEIEGFLQVGTDIKQLQDILWQQLLSFVSLSVIALAAGLGVSYSVLRKTLIPLSNIVDAVENTNAGNLSERIPFQQGQEEIDRLSDSFNEMLERLEESFKYERETKEQMRRFIADASHELRTPLTSIHGFLEVLLRGAANRPEQLFSALNSMYGESKRIIKLVEDLLLLAKLDKAPELQLSATYLTEMVQDMIPQLDVLAGTRTVSYYLNEVIYGNFDSDKIKQVILNLFNNAVQHTEPERGEISLSLHFHNKQVVLVVKDNGSGINEEDLSRIFDRFYRIDSSRARMNGGAGLGLSITKSIVEAHNGSVTASSLPGKGAIFTVSLPLEDPKKSSE
jgi:two-component system, OmpR family, sensor kinase